MTYPTLEHVAMEARPYPTHLLEGCETGLVLFAAAFMGHNDAVHFAEAGMQTTCVDINGPLLRQMAMLYPHKWHFVADDAWRVAENAQNHGSAWDAVSCDTFTGDVMRRSLDSLDLWCSLARKFVTVTITADATDSYRTPPGWLSGLYLRAHDVYWLVLTRA